MLGVNKVILIGHLGRDPEARNTTGGQSVSNFSIATTERWTKDGQKQEKTEWHNIVAWGKLADIANQYLKKGAAVYIEGKIQTRSWDDKDGTKKYKTEIVAGTITMLGGGGKQADNNQANEPPQQPNQSVVDDKDLPF